MNNRYREEEQEKMIDEQSEAVIQELQQLMKNWPKLKNK